MDITCLPDVLSRPNVPFGTGRLAGEVWFGLGGINSNFKGGTNNGGGSFIKLPFFTFSLDLNNYARYVSSFAIHVLIH